MRPIALGKTGISTSPIGLGCVGLTAMPRVADAMSLLAYACDLGITHFDTARSYGAGFSEEILGNFARGRRDRITIATKFGLDPPSLVVGNRRFVAVVKRGLRLIPAIDKMVRRRLAAPTTAGYQYGPEKCRASLERSLTMLGTDYVDLFFVHNGHRSDAEQDDLTDTVIRLRDEGKIRAFGISAPIAYVGDDLDMLPAIYQVAQGDHGVIGGSRWKNDNGRGIIAFATQSKLRPLADALASRPDAVRLWSDRIGANVADLQVVARLLVEAALDANRQGGVLVGTRDREHLATAAGAAQGKAATSELDAFRAMAAELLA